MSDEPIDFSSLDPAREPERWERRITETVEQAELVGSLDLSSLDPYASADGEAKQREAVRRILEATAEPVVVRLAPRALAIAALVAAASWLLVFIDDGQPAPNSDPALAVMGWVSSGEPLSLDQMHAVTGGLDER